MKGIGFIGVFVIAFALANARNLRHGPIYDLADAPFLFLKFVKDYNRVYNDTADVLEHFGAFITNLAEINASNKASNSATFDINEFADYTPEEEEKRLGFNPRPNERRRRVLSRKPRLYDDKYDNYYNYYNKYAY